MFLTSRGLVKLSGKQSFGGHAPPSNLFCVLKSFLMNALIPFGLCSSPGAHQLGLSGVQCLTFSSLFFMVLTSKEQILC